MSIYSAADIGGNSAWKGFSSQTIYIANRIICEADKTKTYFPESIEDLKITDSSGSVIELIQVKNLSSTLSLSDLNPQKEGSFLKRVLDVRKQNEGLFVRLVSYGDIGAELQEWSKDIADKLPEDSLTKKLVSYGYSQPEIGWLRANVIFERTDEAALIELIYSALARDIETAISPEVVFDILINYVSGLSRHQLSTDKVSWQEKVRTVSLSLASISGWKNQFGKTILPLSEYRGFNTDDIPLQRKAYENGISALPQHIMNNFDILRPYWLDTLKDSYSKHNITILHGASGQGKSTLAYRYLIDNYVNSEIFIVNGISNQNQAIDICAALRELENKDFHQIVYIDVQPYDKNWVWLIQQIFTLNLRIPVLVTLREEDYNRNPIDRAFIQYCDIELTLNKTEAHDLYERYPSDKHLSFDDSWEAFGEYSLLLEYIFFLREKESLKSRLQAQIERLINEESNIDGWLLTLLIISYAGRKEVPINSKKLLQHTTISNYPKMLQVFNKEYWIKSSEDYVTLSTLHPVRAMLLCDILFGKLINDEESILLQSLQFTDYYPQTMLIDYFYSNPVNQTFLEKLSDISFSTWATYAGVIESLLWLSVWQYYKTNEGIIEKGNEQTNNTFAFIMMTDITGYLNLDMTSFWDMLKKQNLKHFEQIKILVDSMKEKSIHYQNVDVFMKRAMVKLPLTDTLNSDSLTYCGFALFWHAQRNLMIDERLFDDAICQIDYTDILSACEFCLGVQKQKWNKHYDIILQNIKPILAERLNIIYLNDEQSIVQVYTINDISTSVSNNTKTMLAVEALRLIYSEKDEYHVTLLGADILEGVPVFDNTKRIKNETLPYKWITRLNGWFISIDAYKYLLSDWKAIYYEMTSRRKGISELAVYLAKAIDKYFKSRTYIKFMDEEYLIREKSYRAGNYQIKAPKCATNIYGISSGISQFEDISSTIKEKAEQQERSNEYSSILNAYNDYTKNIQNFLNQKEQLLTDKMSDVKTSNIGRLSYVNLMNALEQFTKMSTLFTSFFSRYISKEKSGADEDENLLLLGIMWEHVYKVPARIENSVLYNKKQELKKQRRSIHDFIEKEISCLSGIQDVVYDDKQEVYVLLELLDSESFLEEFHLHFFNLFKEFDYATFNYALLASCIKSINVQYCFKAIPTIGGFQIRSMDLLNKSKTEFLEHIKTNAVGFDNYHWSITENKIKCILTITGLIASLSIIQKHIKDVLKQLLQQESEKYLIAATMKKWKLECNSIVDDIFMQIKTTCVTLHEYLDKDEQKDILNSFVEVTKSLCDINDLLFNLAVSKDDSKNEFTIDEYMDTYTCMIDILLAE